MMETRLSVPATLLALILAAPPVHANPDLLAAAKAGDREAASAILNAGSHGAETLGRPLLFAARGGHDDVVRLLLEHGADPNTRFTFGSPLHAAARANNADVVALLLQHGGDPDLAAGDFDQSPLHEAAERAAVDVIELLIAQGADVNFRNDKGRPAIHAAAASGKWDVVELLQSLGAAPDLPDMIAAGELDGADIEAGARALHGCNTCHEVAGRSATGPHVGPSLAGIFGAAQAARDDYAYSEAMAKLEGTWTADALNAFLTDPTGVVPGTEMLRVPEMTRQERIGLIAILRDAAREQN